MSESRDLCVVCGSYVPEGAMICPECSRPLAEADVDIKTDYEDFDETVCFEKIPKHRVGYIDIDKKARKNGNKKYR